MDQRRPVHLANIHAGSQIVVFWDVSYEDDIPSDGDDLSGNDESSTSSTSSSDDADPDIDDALHEENDSLQGEAEFQDETTKGDGDDDDANEVSNIHDEFLGGSPKRLKQEPRSTDDTDGLSESSPEENGRGVSGDRRDFLHPAENDVVENDDHESMNEDENPDEHASHLEEASGSLSPPEQSSQLVTMTPRERYIDRRNRIRRYYSGGSYHSSPVAFVAYRMATQMRFKDVGDLLWLACVGVTDAYLHSRLDVAGYSALAMELKTHVANLFPCDAYQRISEVVYAEHLIHMGSGGIGTGRDDRTKLSLSASGRIVAGSDYRFFMLWHSSLYEAMIYSDYVSARLQLNTTQGMQKLHELFAKMGIPLEQCQQPFTFMQHSLQRSLGEKFEMYGEEYGLEDYEFTSFLRGTGYKSRVSASDVSYAVSALLECRALTTTDPAMLDPAQMKSFNEGLDALLSTPSPADGGSHVGTHHNCLVNGASLGGALGTGIRMAQSLQKTILNTAASLIERNAITRLTHFRYAYLTVSSSSSFTGGGMGWRSTSVPHASYHGHSQDSTGHIFSQPLALARLAQYLMDWHRENQKWTGTRARPLILLAERPLSNTYLVAGYEFPEHAGDWVRNRFGKSFQLAAQSMEGHFRFDGFDSHIVEVATNDAQRFLEQLHYLLDQM